MKNLIKDLLKREKSIVFEYLRMTDGEIHITLMLPSSGNCMCLFSMGDGDVLLNGKAAPVVAAIDRRNDQLVIDVSLTTYFKTYPELKKRLADKTGIKVFDILQFTIHRSGEVLMAGANKTTHQLRLL